MEKSRLLAEIMGDIKDKDPVAARKSTMYKQRILRQYERFIESDNKKQSELRNV